MALETRFLFSMKLEEGAGLQADLSVWPSVSFISIWKNPWLSLKYNDELVLSLFLWLCVCITCFNLFFFHHQRGIIFSPEFNVCLHPPIDVLSFHQQFIQWESVISLQQRLNYSGQFGLTAEKKVWRDVYWTASFENKLTKLQWEKGKAQRMRSQTEGQTKPKSSEK